MYRQLVLTAVCIAPLLGQVRLTAEQADQLAIEKPAARYPRDAESARVQGPVIVEIEVSEEGSVLSANLVYGHPLLADAMKAAAAKRKYRPYVVDGQPAPFVTTVGAMFGLERPAERERELAAQYQAIDTECQTKTGAREWRAAETACSGALWMADQIPGRQGIERVRANDNLGVLYIEQRRFGDALEYFTKSMALLKERPGTSQAGFGYAYRNLGFAEHGLGHLDRAREDYAAAEKALERAKSETTDASARTRYAATLTSAMEYHLKAAQQAGATEEAAQVQKRLGALP